MAIQRHATTPGESMQSERTLRYSLSKIPKKNTATPAPSTIPERKLSVGRDLLITILVFGILLIALFFLTTQFS